MELGREFFVPKFSKGPHSKVETMRIPLKNDIPLDSERVFKYLGIYNANIDWRPPVGSLLTTLNKKLPPEEVKTVTRDILSACILLPVIDKTVRSNPPENLLFWISKYRQFEGTNWANELVEVFRQDDENSITREKCSQMGIIHPLEYVPNTRQASRWLLERAEKDPTTKDCWDSAKQKLQNLVYIYGGAVVCGVFAKPEWQTRVNNIINWRSGYFFERLIYQVYTPAQIITIKQHELNQVDAKLVKKIKES